MIYLLTFTCCLPKLVHLYTTTITDRWCTEHKNACMNKYILARHVRVQNHILPGSPYPYSRAYFATTGKTSYEVTRDISMHSDS